MARLLKQSNLLREEFEERIRQKVQGKKDALKASLDEELPTILSWIAKPLAGFFFDREKERRDKKGAVGELSVFNQAKSKLSDDWLIINDVVIEPEPEVFAQIDHIFIGPSGLYVIETKAWEGSYTAFRDKWKRREGKNWVECSSPTNQNYRHAKLIGKWLSGTGLVSIPEPSSKWVVPLVVFTKAQWLKTTNCNMPVFQSIPSLIDHIYDQSTIYLSSEQIQKISELIIYPSLNKALRQNQIFSYDISELPPVVAASEEVMDDLPQYEEGKTKEGRRYVRITGSLEDASKVFDYFKLTYSNIESPRKDRFKDNTYFFYLVD